MSIVDWHRNIISGTRRGPLAAFWRLLLGLLAQLFLLAVSLRTRFYQWGLLRGYKVGGTVISIGNIVAGGTGKTPMTIALARQLQERGLKVGIVARNYRSKFRAQFGVVSDGERILMIPDEAGDEPYLIVKELPGVPMVVSRDKTRGCAVMRDEFEPDVILIDDAFQHFRLYRDADIVLIDATRPFGHGYLLPRGLLREPPNALRRADLIVISRVTAAADLSGLKQQLKGCAPRAGIYTSELVVKGLRNYRTGQRLPASFLAGKRLVMVSGIARPDLFEKMVLDYNPTFAIPYHFADHHHYQREEMSVLQRLCDENRLELMVTTGKDAVKLSDVLNVSVPVLVLQVETRVLEPGFVDAVLKAAGK